MPSQMSVLLVSYPHSSCFRSHFWDGHFPIGMGHTNRILKELIEQQGAEHGSKLEARLMRITKQHGDK